MLKIVTRVGIMTVFLIVGLAAGLGYGHLQLGREQQIHQIKINEVNRKMALLQKKASEEREAKSGMEGRNRSLLAEVEKLKKENADQAEAMKKSEAEAQSYEAKLKEAGEQLTQMKAAHDEVSAQLAQVIQAAKEIEGQARLLAAGKQTLETSLAKVNQDLDNCRNHNARLCLIADEMLQKQQSRSTVGNILRSEPLTQIGKVELEKLTQEYKDKIEQEQIRNK